MILTCDKSYQSIDFYIPEHYTSVAVNCSGGADSSILLLMTAQYLKNEGREDTTKLSVLTCSNDLKGRWNGRKAADVIDYVIRKTGYKNFDIHYTYYRDVQDEKYFHEVETKLFVQKRIDILLSGITSNPPLGASTENKNGELVVLDEGRVPSRDGGGRVELMRSGTSSFYTPFTNVDKRFIAAMYEQYDAMDMLEMTRSCEAIPQEYDPKFEHEPCGTCWWCLERKWGFGKF